MTLRSSSRTHLLLVNPAQAQAYIVNPLRGPRAARGMANMFSTHPPIEDRIARLERMAGR